MTDTRTFSASHHVVAILAMAAVVVASNFLVQFPVRHFIGGINLADTLTWGAFTYPVAFLVTDLTNRRFGPAAARQVVMAGFLIAVVVSVWLATPRIAIASGTAFLIAQMLDVTIFDRMRKLTWWKAPVASSFIGSVIDTLLFFGIAFSASFAFIDSLFGMEDSSLAFPVPFLGISDDTQTLLWVSLAIGDFLVKLLVAVVLLAPYRLVLGLFRALPDERAA
ncbi:VUT family protein [Roseibium sp. FZY0029]|uniref:VUT family protein n=1 Tax=Roseibium sp. FZY0029 TaxID=3116647 RepID=UPI002EA24552|nr:VUT family protein [Roseibium sp. FZY0029]